jgi:predicted nucleic acid-binding protein
MNASARFTFDTNILFYAADASAGAKHHRALLLTDSALGRDCVLTLQCLGELMNAIIKRRTASASKAKQIIWAYRATFPIVPAAEADLEYALLAHQQHGIPFWDAMLWATAKRAGCTLLLTEDLQDGRDLEGVKIRNPFSPGFDLDAF